MIKILCTFFFLWFGWCTLAAFLRFMLDVKRWHDYEKKVLIEPSNHLDQIADVKVVEESEVNSNASESFEFDSSVFS